MKPKEETKAAEDKSNNKSKAEIIFNELINKRKYLVKKLHDSVDYENLNFKHVDPKNNDVGFYGYINSKKPFSIIKNNEISFDDALKSQNEFLNKLSNIKIRRKTSEQKEVVSNLKKFSLSRGF